MPTPKRRTKLDTVSASIEGDDDDQDEDFEVTDDEGSQDDTDAPSSDEESSEAESDGDTGAVRRGASASRVQAVREAALVKAKLEQARANGQLPDDTSAMPDDILLDEDVDFEQLFAEDEDEEDEQADLQAIFAGSDSEDDEEEDEEGGGSRRPAYTDDIRSVASGPGAAPSLASEPFYSPGRARTRNRTLAAVPETSSPPLEAFGAVLPNLDLEMPIAQRTRTHVNLADVPMEDLEALLARSLMDEPLLHFGVDDAEEYERFLASLQGGGILGVATDTEAEVEDSDDEDFINELERMLEEEAGGVEWLNGAGGARRSRRRARGPRKFQKVTKPPRRSARLTSKNDARPMYVNRILDRRNARVAADPNTAQPIGLSELAMLAAAMGAAETPLALQTGPANVPLPTDHPDVLALAGDLVAWHPPLPKAVRKYQKSATEGEVEPPIVGAAFQPEQYAQLHYLIHQHVQILTQTLALAVATKDHESSEASREMLTEISGFAETQSADRKAAGIPPYVRDCLGIGRAAQLANSGRNKVWAPKYTGPVHTVADVALLKEVPKMLQAMPGVPEDAVLIVPPQPPPKSIEFNIDKATASAAPTPADSNSDEDTVSDGESDGGGAAGGGEELSDGGTEAAKKARKLARRRLRRVQRKTQDRHTVWTTLPSLVAHALAAIRAFFNPADEPKAWRLRNPTQMLFTPMEDSLLAWGIRKHAYDWQRIKDDLLPSKTTKMLFNRKKNRVAGVAPKNIVKDTVSIMTKKLTDNEIELLAKAVKYYGKQPKKWEIICRDHLRHRHPMVLSMLWSEYTKNIENGGGQQTVQSALLTINNSNPIGAAAGTIARPSTLQGPRLVQPPPRPAGVAAPPAPAEAPQGLQAQTMEAAYAAAMAQAFPPGTNPQAAAMAGAYGPAAMQQIMQMGYAMMMAGVPMPGMPGMNLQGAGMPMPPPGMPGAHLQNQQQQQQQQQQMMMMMMAGAGAGAGGMQGGMPGMSFPGWYMPNNGAGLQQMQMPAGMESFYPGLGGQGQALQGQGQQVQAAQVGEKRVRDEEEDREPTGPQQQQQQVVQEQGDGKRVDEVAGEKWNSVDEKALLKAVLGRGGVLKESVAKKIAKEMGKSAKDVVSHSVVLMERFREANRQKKQKK